MKKICIIFLIFIYGCSTTDIPETTANFYIVESISNATYYKGFCLYKIKITDGRYVYGNIVFWDSISKFKINDTIYFRK